MWGAGYPCRHLNCTYDQHHVTNKYHVIVPDLFSFVSRPRCVNLEWIKSISKKKSTIHAVGWCDHGCGISHWCRWNSIQFYILVSILKGFFDNFKELVMQSCQKLGIFHFQSQFQKPKLTSIFLKIVFLPKFTLVEQLKLKSL